MVTTERSKEYTPYALSSFFEHSTLQSQDEFILIDNDGTFDSSMAEPYSINLIQREKPFSFAANVNWTMALAAEKKADLFFLNNDIIFTEKWLEPLLIPDPIILSPTSNQQLQYRTEQFECKFSMTLQEYIGNEQHLSAIVRTHQQRMQDYRFTHTVPFYCVKIPLALFQKVGQLDETFGQAGAEDTDYCVRCYLNGFSVKFAMQSFVLHFQGRSTWCGETSQKETRQREQDDQMRISLFEKKWGPSIRKWFMFNDQEIIKQAAEAEARAVCDAYRCMLESFIRDEDVQKS